jgi:hypothetical protein
VLKSKGRREFRARRPFSCPALDLDLDLDRGLLDDIGLLDDLDLDLDLDRDRVAKTGCPKGVQFRSVKPAFRRTLAHFT